MTLTEAQEVASKFAPHVGHLISFKTYSMAEIEHSRLEKVNVAPNVSNTLTYDVTLTVEAFLMGSKVPRIIFARQAVGCECSKD